MKVPFDILSDYVRETADFELDGETYGHFKELDEDMDDNGRSVSHIYKRQSDEKYFRIDLYWIRYGYEWYEFESFYNDGKMTEVVPQEVTIVKWVTV